MNDAHDDSHTWPRYLHTALLPTMTRVWNNCRGAKESGTRVLWPGREHGEGGGGSWPVISQGSYVARSALFFDAGRDDLWVQLVTGMHHSHEGFTHKGGRWRAGPDRQWR